MVASAVKVIPLTRDAAKEYVRKNHRHNKPPTSHKFSLGLLGDGGELVGVLVAGLPVARWFDDGLTLELTRVCTDGTANACSMLVGAARRAAAAMGYERIVTYTQAEEGGASMRAAGMVRDAELEPRGSWAKDSKQRQGRLDIGGGVPRVRWIWRRDGRYNVTSEE
jgi:hypothetical protein